MHPYVTDIVDGLLRRKKNPWFRKPARYNNNQIKIRFL